MAAVLGKVINDRSPPMTRTQETAVGIVSVYLTPKTQSTEVKGETKHPGKFRPVQSTGVRPAPSTPQNHNSCAHMQGTEQSFAAYAASALSHMHQSMAAAVCSSSSSSRSTGMYSDLAPNLLRYVELLGQYDKWSVSQRRQMLNAIQTQLLPQVSGPSVRLAAVRLATIRHRHTCC